MGCHNRSNNKSGINESFKHNDQNITDPNKIANKFCIFFFTNIGKQYADEIPQSQYSSKQNQNQRSMFMAPTNKEEVTQLFNSLRKKNSSWHDKISSAFIKDMNQ